MNSKLIKISRLKFSCIAIAFFFLPIYSNAQSTNTLPGWAFGGFVRPQNGNPIISPDSTVFFNDPMTGKPNAWESDNTFNPGATIKDGKIIVLYRAEDNSGNGIGFHTSRIGYAESDDGLHFNRKNVPVLFPANDSQKEFEWPGGCEDPRVAVTQNGTYVLFYTQWNRKLPRLGVATSTDLIHWKKHGPIFEKAYHGKYFNMATKSASILTKMNEGKQVIAKINGKYWMYWGEHHVYAATSSNLVDWQPVENKNGKLKELISPRKGFFDSDLTECGPPALITKKGILLFYNGKNKSGDDGDKRYSPDSYCAGQALFDLKDPSKPIARLDVPFLRPMEPFEKSGQYVNGTVFIEGMVFFKKKWFLYYGCADSRVAVAVYDPANPALPDPIIVN
ncbi:MAG TPA: glycoside hydrolase family 130 protein [Hanamia sp.]